jgi:DNA-directed RNA polymerase specialized sigma24 family protein
VKRPSADRDSARELFAEHATELRAAVRAAVHTSEANVDDACAFAWLQLVRYQPQRDGNGAVFPWLLTAATREAVKLDRRARRWADLQQLAEAAVGLSPHTIRLAHHDRLVARPPDDPGQRLDGRLELLRAMGYTRNEMAAMTGDSCRTVDRQLTRGRRKLRAAPNASEARRRDC